MRPIEIFHDRKKVVPPLGAALLVTVAIVLLSGGNASGVSSSSAEEPRSDVGDSAPYGEMVGPCSIPERRKSLLCPDLSMRKPFDLWFSYSGGRLLLHAANDIQSRGRGPMEVRGRRVSSRRMVTHQVIYKKGGGKIHRSPTGHLNFHPIPGQGFYWKYEYAAEFELWKLSPSGETIRRARVGPKLDYCFRDLERTRPSRRSPSGPVYPGCSQGPGIRKRTLGTSVGWSDVYPSTYDDNFINATGLRGCYRFRQVADPRNQISELEETNNAGSIRIRLTGRPGPIRSC